MINRGSTSTVKRTTGEPTLAAGTTNAEPYRNHYADNNFHRSSTLLFWMHRLEDEDEISLFMGQTIAAGTTSEWALVVETTRGSGTLVMCA